MRNLIDKLMLLESDGNNLPRIAHYLQRRTKSLIELYFHTASPKEIIDFGENTFGKDLRIITVSMPFRLNKELETLEYFTNDDEDTFKCTMYSNKYYSQHFNYNLVRDVGKKFFNRIGFTDETVDIKNAKIGTHFGSIEIDITQTNKLLEVINAAYRWRQETIGDLG